MQVRRRPLPVSLLLLIHLVSINRPVLSHEIAQELADSKVSRTADLKQGSDPSAIIEIQLKPTSVTVVGTKDAPVDGKDGRPHSGPWVETAAERDRKKAKESGEKEMSASGKNAAPKDTKKGDTLADSWDSPIPMSNDGVMDDPNRLGPAEGTRGTNGGITEKTREKKLQEGLDGVKPEKVPEKPKDVPPLPHSEQEKLRLKEGKYAYEPDKANSKSENEKPKAIEKDAGGLEVCDHWFVVKYLPKLIEDTETSGSP